MIAELSVIYTPEHAKTKSLQAQLDAVQKSYRAARLALAGKIGDQYQEALRKERLLEAGYLAQTGQVVSEQEKTTKYNLLKAEAESDRQLYDSLQQQLKQASVASAMKASNIRIVDAAAVPAQPYKPNIPRSVIVGTLLGLFGAVGIALLRERSNQTIREVGEVVDILGVPELGLIPNARLALSRADQKLMVKNAQLGLPAGGHAYAEIDLVTWRSSRSIIADSFRSAVTSMLFASFSTKRCQRFVITSASAGEGKSTVASNLGVAIAEMGDRVLLIDGDLRNPRLQRIFSLEPQPGLSTLLKDAPAGSEAPRAGSMRSADRGSEPVCAAGRTADFLFEQSAVECALAGDPRKALHPVRQDSDRHAAHAGHSGCAHSGETCGRRGAGGSRRQDDAGCRGGGLRTSSQRRHGIGGGHYERLGSGGFGGRILRLWIQVRCLLSRP